MPWEPQPISQVQLAGVGLRCNCCVKVASGCLKKVLPLGSFVRSNSDYFNTAQSLNGQFTQFNVKFKGMSPANTNSLEFPSLSTRSLMGNTIA